ncbi:MAG: ferritin family protein [Clostridiaceae bacterium]|nr:ferritin family protein [Clostridiaceae bacterium]
MDKIKNILKFAMRMEKDAEVFYSHYMDKVQSESIKKLFEDLSEMEKNHYNLLKSKYELLEYKEPPITISWVVDNNFTQVDPSIISSNSDIIEEKEKELSDLSVIRMAYLMENDFYLFYKNAAKEVDNKEASEFLQNLAEWEEGHRTMFQKKYEELLKKHWGEIASIIFA